MKPDRVNNMNEVLYKSFNINDTVKVKLTTLGNEIWKKDFERYGVDPKFTFDDKKALYTDGEGWTSFQLHDLMAVFGEYLSNGFAIPFETNILIEFKN